MGLGGELFVTVLKRFKTARAGFWTALQRCHMGRYPLTAVQPGIGRDSSRIGRREIS